MNEYNGVQLEEKEVDALLSLEKKIQKPLKHKNFYPDDMDYFTGFFSVNNTVVHLVIQNEYSLKEFPKEILDLENLRILIIGECNIKSIPTEISKLKFLKVLSIDSCRSITDLPNTIGKLSNLEEFWFGFSSIKKLPNSVGNLKELRILYLEDNKLKTLPDSIGGLGNLETLYLYNNELKTLPSSIGQLNSLKELNLSGNYNLHELPNSLLNIKYLEELSIQDLDNLSLQSSKIIKKLKEKGVKVFS